MKPRFLLIASALLFATTILPAFVSHADCPECHKNSQPMPGSGPAPDGSGRRLINVKVDDSLNSAPGQTDPNMWNAVQGCNGCQADGALNQWNNARDGQTTNPSDPRGWPTGYYFQLNQSTQNADIVIRRANPGELPTTARGGSGMLTDSSGHGIAGRRVIILPAESVNWPQDVLASVIAHELGHNIGLADNYDIKACGRTIMNQLSRRTQRPITTTVQPNDVASSNKNLNDSTRQSCGVERTTPLYQNGVGGGGTGGGSTGGGGGGGGGGGCYFYSDYYYEYGNFPDADRTRCTNTWLITGFVCNGVFNGSAELIDYGCNVMQ